MRASTRPGAGEAESAWGHDSRHSLLLGAMAWALVVLLIVPEGFDYRTLADNGATSSGGVLTRLTWLGLIAGSGLLICWRAGLAWLLARTLNPFLLVFVALAFASVAWSIDPTLGLRRLIRLGTIVLVCSAFVLAGWHERRLQNVVRPILTLMLAGSIVFGMLYPQLAIHQQSSPELLGAWRGLTNHKNGLGALASMALILWTHAWLTRETSRTAVFAGVAVAATCLILSRSSTSLATTVFVLLLMIVLMRAPGGSRPYLPHLVWLLVGMLLIYALAVLDVIPGLGTLLAPITALTGKDPTLTGRTAIWSILADHIRQHPMLGTGYASYWTADPVPGTDSFEFVRRMDGFYPGTAHNGYLEVLNDLGWTGLAVLFAYIITHVRQSLTLLKLDYNQAVLYLALFFQQAISNFSESRWFSVLSVDFVIMTLVTMSLARSILEHRLRRAFGEPSRPTAHSTATATR